MRTSRSKPLVLAIDIGTSSVRAALHDLGGKPVPHASVKREYQFAITEDGGSEIDAYVLFRQVVEVIDAVLAKSSRIDADIQCVASCAFWHSLVGVDVKGRPTTPAFGWVDTRSRKYTEVHRKRFDELTIHNRTGARFHSSFWPAKLLWLRKERPAIWAKTARWLSFSDYLALKLSGEAVTSLSMASATGIFDQRKCDWDGELLRYLNVTRKQLPTIADFSYGLSSKSLKRWPRLEYAGWFPTIGDGAADNIGSGCITKNRAALMIGTSGAMRVAYKGEPPKKIPDGLWCYRIDRERVVIGGALSDGGNLYEWLKRRLNGPKNAEDEMRRRGADAHGLTVLPFLHGERSTGYNEDAKAHILGLTASHDAVDILQAAMESVAYRFAEILEQIETVTRIDEIVASGGALRDSPVWAQIIADVMGRDLLVSDAAESSSRGAVLLALESLGKIDAIDSFPVSTVKLEFHPKCHEIYKKARKRHALAYKTLFAQHK